MFHLHDEWRQLRMRAFVRYAGGAKRMDIQYAYMHIINDYLRQ